MDDDMDMTESDDDLEITKTVRRSLHANKPTNAKNLRITESESESVEAGDNEVPGRSLARDALEESERVDWSEDDGAKAYEKFKKRGINKRKRATVSTNKAKNAHKDGIVGKKPRGTDSHGKPTKETRAFGDDSDDDLMEYTIPGYLQTRRTRFEKRMQTLREAGLRLPPKYDEVEFSDDERLADLEERPIFPKAHPSGNYKDVQLPYSLGLVPAPIAQWLREYQVQGTSFLHKLFVYQSGGILGDDMGLGKTIQVIAFLTAAFGKTGDERDAKRMRKMRRAGAAWYPRVLVVCPGTLIENWKAELQRWGWWHVDVFHGDKKEEAIQTATAGRTEIMITTYTTYRLNKSAVNTIEWDCVIADECHQIKGRTSETAQAMNEVNALCRIGLTGTAIQNSYDELWTLLNWTNPGKFGPISTWRSSISEPLRAGQSHDATIYQLSKARKTAKALVQNLLPQFFLRRMKTLIADQLPKKSDRIVFCPLTDTQADAYERVLESEILECIKNSSDPCDCNSGKRSGWCCHTHVEEMKWQSYVFPAIANLQKLSNHLALLIPQGADPKEKQAKDLSMLQEAVPDRWRDLYLNRDSIINYSNPEFCGKWKILKKLLRFWHESGDKVLIFSHSVRLLKMLQMLFNHTSYNVSYLDGAMSYEDRAKTVDDFNADPAQFVFLISTKAGGVGLNITSANKVVIVDPNWNPSYDLQAQDRAYRIGQSRDVEVFRLVSAGTIEEVVYARQIYKQQQANIGYTASSERRYFKGVQENPRQKGEIFGLANLFAFNSDNIVLRDIVNKTNVAESKAGVSIVGLDIDDSQSPHETDPLTGNSDDEDSAMSQLAALVAGNNNNDNNNNDHSENKSAAPHKPRNPPTNPKTDPVQAILASAGVEYTHENSEVIGSSKVEARLSRRAQEAQHDLHLAEQHVFASTQEEERHQPDRSGTTAHHNPYYGEQGEGEEGEPKWQYHPPQEVRKRQFCTMARTFGFRDATEFALVVEGWTQAQRRNCLDKFYKVRRERG